MDGLQQLTHILDNFLACLQLRFELSQFDEPQGALFELTQTSIVREHQTRFESSH